MSNILKNSEIKKVIIAVVTLGIIFYCISFLSINLTFNNISKNYAKENIALAGAILEKYPELKEAIMKLDNIINEEEMAKLNYLVETEGEDESKVAKDFLIEKGLVK